MKKLTISNRLKNYFLRSKRSTSSLHESIIVSTEEVSESFLKILSSPSIPSVIQFSKDFIGSSAWIFNSYIKVLTTLAGFKSQGKQAIDEDDWHTIIDKVSTNIRLPDDQYSMQQIFQAIYMELDYAHHHPSYETPLKFPKIFPTIVLVSGVFNEIYKTAAFERGVSHAAKLCGLKYIVADTHGFEGSAYNCTLLEDKLFSYIDQNPDEKLWVIAYSKGGIDSLHFMHKHKEWSEKHIAGVSTIASPILGSPHLNSKLFKTVKFFQNLSPLEFSQKILSDRDILKKDFLKSLDSDNQGKWFHENYHELPQSPFYTSLGLEAEWYEAHLYMVATKLLFASSKSNDGVVDIDSAFFPNYFKSINLGVVKGHHLIGARSSGYTQESLILTHIIFLKYMNLI